MLRPIFIYTFLALRLCLPSASGCDIPVFRYALDHWPADNFQLEATADVLRTEPLATEFRNLSDGSGLNLQTTVASNDCQLFFPSHVRGATTPVWKGELTSKNYKSLTDSPARKELAKRILAGDSAVWVLVECGKNEADESTAKLFTERLSFLESAIGLPPIDPSDPDSTHKFLEIIARHTTRMERLVKDLLRLARLDARQEALEMARCDVRQIFSGVIVELSPAIEAKDQRIAIDVSHEAAQIDGDPAKLHDIVRNLVENAVNYSPDGAVVRLAAARVDGSYTITVADSGPGIPPEDLTRVFERFYRVDKSRSRPGGTGLGLAIVKHLVELHGGEARAENAADGGAVFTVRLP